MATALDIITDALQNIGVYSPGEQLGAADSATGLTVLNDMIDQWQEEYIPVYVLSNATANLTSGNATYTVGAGGNFAIARPIAIQFGPSAANCTIANVTSPVNVVSQNEFEQIESKGNVTGTPLYAFYDPQYPTGVLNINPAPASTSGNITVSAWVPAATLTTLSTANTFASGAIRALKTNLAIRLHPYFLDSQISQAIMLEAMESKNALEYTNQASRAMKRRHKFPREPRTTPV